MNKRNIVVPIISVAVLVAVYFLLSFFAPPGGKNTAVSSPSVSIFPSASSNVAPSARPSPAASSAPDASVPTCRLGGEIVFISPDTYENRNNYLEYQNVKDEVQLIKWTLTPSDDLAPGPNMFSRLTLPSGKTLISATLPAAPKAKTYEATARITYFKVVNGIEQALETPCSGKTTIKIDY
jgi:hypothetical protein